MKSKVHFFHKMYNWSLHLIPIKKIYFWCMNELKWIAFKGRCRKCLWTYKKVRKLEPELGFKSMDFLGRCSLKMILWSVEHFFTISYIKTLERHFFNECLSNILITEKSNFDEKMVKKCSNEQRFIVKEIARWKIHTLVETVKWRTPCT